MGMKKGEKQIFIDHINTHDKNNKQDNRRENLRKATPLNNASNRIKKEGTTSQYIGVYKKKAKNKYQASIIINYKFIFLGYFDNEIDAAEKRDLYVVQNKLDYHVLNFPLKKEEYLKKDKIETKLKKTNSNYIGIFKTRYNKFGSNINIGDKKIWLGSFETALEAAVAYDKYIVINNIPHKTLNFPKDYDYDPDSTVKMFFKDLGNNIYDINGILISKESYDKIKNYHVYINTILGYAYIIYKGIHQGLSRFLMGVTDPSIFVDHINSNPIDNTLPNLRLSNPLLNSQNVSKRKNTSSEYHGVSKNRNSFISSIQKDHKVIFNFSNIDEILCARARDLFLIKYLPYSHYKKIFMTGMKQTFLKSGMIS